MKKKKQLNVAVFAGLSDKKLISKLVPLIQLQIINRIFLLRRKNLEYKKIKTLSTEKYIRNKFFGDLLRIFFGIYVIVFRKVNTLIGYYTTNHIIYCYYLSRIFRIPYIANIIGDEFSNEDKIKKHLKYVMKASAIVTRGNITKNFFISKGFRENLIFPIPNYFSFNTQQNINPNHLVYDIIYTGSFVDVKRIDILIKSVYIVKNKYNTIIKVCLVGDGRLREKYKEIIKKLDIENQFHFVGNQSNVEYFLLRSKVFIMTSEFEGLPQAMIEALACGLPVIMPRISNIPDYAIDEYNSLLVEPLDVEGFADAIYKMLTDDDLYNRLKTGAEKFREEHEYEFSMENITNNWNKLFFEIYN